MSGELTIEIKGLAPIESKLRSPAMIAGPLRMLLNDTGLLAQRVARQESPRDIVALARSIGLEVQPLFARVYTPLQYAPVMEYGRTPGSRPPPSNVLEGWLRRHGIDPSLAFVVARAIARRGIKGRFFMAKAKIAVESALPGKLDQMAKRIEAAWGSK